MGNVDFNGAFRFFLRENSGGNRRRYLICKGRRDKKKSASDMMSRLKCLTLTILTIKGSGMKNWFWQNAQGATSEASTLAVLIDAARRGEIGPSTVVSNDGETWKSAAEVPALADALGLDVSPTSGAEGADSTPQKRKRSGCAVVGGVCCVLLICVAFGFRFVGRDDF